MSDTGKDRWNSLLETLGVPASKPLATPPSESSPSDAPTEELPAAPAKQQTISMLRPEKPKATAKPKPTKTPPKSPSYWSRIAGALGLESAAEPASIEEPQIEPQSELKPPSYARPEAPRPARTSREEERSHGRSRREETERPRREEADRARREEARPREDREQVAASEPEIKGFGLGFDDDKVESPRARDPESGPVLDYDRPDDADLSFGQPAAAERGFDEETNELRDGRRRRRRRGRGRGRGRGGEEAPHTTERNESDIEPDGEDADFDIDRDEVLDIEADLGGEPAGRQRGPRGAETPRDREANDYLQRGERPSRHHEERSGPDREDDRGSRSRRGRSERPAPGGPEREDTRVLREPRRAARPTTPADDEPDEDLQAAGMDDDDSGDGGSPTHKRIPTWDEAVNMLIDANMASRANSPDRPDRGRGRGRGRGR